MKYLRVKKNPDYHGEEYTNAYFDLFALLGMYSKYLLEGPTVSFEDYLTLGTSVEYMQNKKHTLHREGSKYIRDFIKEKKITGISARGVRRIAWKPKNSVIKLPEKTPDVLKEVFSHINNHLRVQGLDIKAYQALFDNCEECIDFPNSDHNDQCANRSLGFQKIALEQAKCKLKVRKVKENIISIYKEMAVIARCGNGGP